MKTKHTIKSAWYVVDRKTGFPLLPGFIAPASSPADAWHKWGGMFNHPESKRLAADKKTYVARRFTVTLEPIGDTK